MLEVTQVVSGGVGIQTRVVELQNPTLKLVVTETLTPPTPHPSPLGVPRQRVFSRPRESMASSWKQLRHSADTGQQQLQSVLPEG